jgi:hypothetical protein
MVITKETSTFSVSLKTQQTKPFLQTLQENMKLKVIMIKITTLLALHVILIMFKSVFFRNVKSSNSSLS